MNTSSIISVAIRTIELEANSISGLKAFINTDFVKAVELIARNKGRLIISGVGKTAIIAQKMVATLNSTGTPSVFMHAADAIHGDLGVIQSNDIVLLISKSGNSAEIGNTQSYLAKPSDIVLITTVELEACPINLAPTSSTTAQMVMGDALAVCLMEIKGFKSDDFAKYHPGGTLGKQLYLRVEELVLQHAKPKVLPLATIKEVIIEMTEKRLGAAVVVNEFENILGIITDGDLRRMLEKTTTFENLQAKDIMSNHPKTIAWDALAANALEEMKKYNISQLVVEKNEIYAGIIHLHDLVKEGII